MKRRGMRSLSVMFALLFSAWLCGCDDGGAPVERRSEAPIEFSGGLVVTDAWAGEWHVRVKFGDCLSGATTMVEDVIDIACPGDTIRLAGTGLFETCTGTATDGHIDVDCEYKFADGDCRVTASMTLSLERDGDELAGAGSWRASTSAGCNAPYSVGCEAIAIAGTRLSADTSPCDTVATVSAPSILKRRR